MNKSYPFYTSNNEVKRILDDLMKNSYAEMSTNMARDFGRYKSIKKYRRNIRIAEDRKYRVSIITLKKPLELKKNGEKYFFISP